MNTERGITTFAAEKGKMLVDEAKVTEFLGEGWQKVEGKNKLVFKKENQETGKTLLLGFPTGISENSFSIVVEPDPDSPYVVISDLIQIHLVRGIQIGHSHLDDQIRVSSRSMNIVMNLSGEFDYPTIISTSDRGTAARINFGRELTTPRV